MDYLQEQILAQVNSSIAKAIEDELVGYNKPLNTLVDKVVRDNFEEVHEIVNRAFQTVVRTEAFETSVLEEFERKVAKILVSKLTGQVEKAVNLVNQDPRLRAKMILAIEDIIENKKKEQAKE